MKKITLKNQGGFTLVELMVTVAIIGVLSAIAVPNYQKFIAQARQSEAKTDLGAIYTTETAALASISSVSLCLQSLGYNVLPTAGSVPTQYYSSGFKGALDGQRCGPNNAQSCLAYSFNGATIAASCLNNTQAVIATSNGTWFTATAAANGSTAATSFGLPVAALPGTMTTNGAVYGTSTTNVGGWIAVAWGIISSNTAADWWSIDQNSVLTNYKSGL